MKRITVGLSENDMNGIPSERVFQIDFTFGGEFLLRLECDANEQEHVKTHELGGIEMYGQKIDTSSRREWAGNMMWNEYEISRPEAARFIHVLKVSGMWSVTEGVSELFEKWERNEVITSEDLEAATASGAK